MGGPGRANAVDRGLVLIGGFAGDVAAGVAVAVEFGEVAASGVLSN
jgi:hypothetical protein